MKDLDMDTFNAGSTQVKVSGPNCASGGAGPKMKMIELQAARGTNINLEGNQKLLYEFLYLGNFPYAESAQGASGPWYEVDIKATDTGKILDQALYGNVSHLPTQLRVQSLHTDPGSARFGPWALTGGEGSSPWGNEGAYTFAMWPRPFELISGGQIPMQCDTSDDILDQTEDSYHIMMCWKPQGAGPGPVATSPPPPPPSPPPAATSPPPSPPTPPSAPKSVPASCYKTCEIDDHPPWDGRNDFCASIYPYVHWAFQTNGTTGEIGNHRASTCEGAHNFTQDYDNNGHVTCDCGECFEHKGCTKAGGATQDPHLHFPNGGEADLRGRDGAHPPPFGDTRGEA